MVKLQYEVKISTPRLIWIILLKHGEFWQDDHPLLPSHYKIHVVMSSNFHELVDSSMCEHRTSWKVDTWGVLFLTTYFTYRMHVCITETFTVCLFQSGKVETILKFNMSEIYWKYLANFYCLMMWVKWPENKEIISTGILKNKDPKVRGKNCLCFCFMYCSWRQLTRSWLDMAVCSSWLFMRCRVWTDQNMIPVLLCTESLAFDFCFLIKF